tara:strand:- start:123 stop:335 length:213 start_codon:yes stop_codon:yes gene_type:complete
MKAQSLKKVPESIENIYAQISEANANNQFKCFIPHFIYVTNETKLQLIKDGYKVYEGNWDSIITGLIIEW